MQAHTNNNHIKNIMKLRGSGYSISVMKSIKTKYGNSCPRELIEIYLLAGKDKVVRSGTTEFISPNDWIIKGDMVIFAREEQGVCCWAFKMTELATI